VPKSLRAVVFDFDGVTIDTETPEFDVWSEIFELHGVALCLDDWARTMGRGIAEVSEHPEDWLGREVSGLDLESIRADARQEILRRIEEKPAMPGVESLVASLGQSGIAVGIASSSHLDWIEPKLERLGLRGEFAQIVGADHVIRTKPSPELYELACLRLGVAPDEAIALEDSPNGVSAGIAAGLLTIAVPNRLTRLLDLSHADDRLESLVGVDATMLMELFARHRVDFAGMKPAQ
jgi:HAD superfamily hydrolase (TIGR01509 family)